MKKVVTMVSGVDNNEMIQLLKTEMIEIPGVPDSYKIVGDRSVEIVSHETNPESLTDTVIAKISGVSETKKHDLEVKDSDRYIFDSSVEGVLELIDSDGIEIYSSGTYNYLDSDMISNMSLGEFVPYGIDNTGLKADCTFTAECYGVLMDIEATLTFEYSNGRWHYDRKLS